LIAIKNSSFYPSTNYHDAQKEKFIEGMTLLNKELNKPLY